jgi:hypothetical protein
VKAGGRIYRHRGIELRYFWEQTPKSIPHYYEERKRKGKKIKDKKAREKQILV